MIQKRGYTLIEMLVATALTLVLLGAVIRIFGQIGGATHDARTALESADRLRMAAILLQNDLKGVTVTMLPPRSPAAEEGYFELIEGENTATANIAINREDSNSHDSTVGDFDDILMFTTRSPGKPFTGLCAGAEDGSGTIQSEAAEVAWFVRCRTLYRRVLLVAPNAPLVGSNVFFANNDISVRFENDNLVGNTLGDLTKRENRYAHAAFPVNPTDFPFDARRWQRYGLPTLSDVSTAWPPSPCELNLSEYDFWKDPAIDHITKPGPRAGEDVVLTNVIAFDVRVWDPLKQAYVDLGMAGGAGLSGPPNPASGLAGGAAKVYDTWSLHYEYNGIDEDGNGTADESANGFDDNGIGGVDDISERETSPPYPVPLRGIQIKIRTFDPQSRQLREVTIVQDFLPK